MIKAKLYMNVHWMVLYVFCSDMKFKMAATAGLSLTLDPKPLGQLKPNCPGIVNIGPYGKMFKCLLLRNYKYGQTVHECSLDGSSTNFTFFVPI